MNLWFGYAIWTSHLWIFHRTNLTGQRFERFVGTLIPSCCSFAPPRRKALKAHFSELCSLCPRILEGWSSVHSKLSWLLNALAHSQISPPSPSILNTTRMDPFFNANHKRFSWPKPFGQTNTWNHHLRNVPFVITIWQIGSFTTLG